MRMAGCTPRAGSASAKTITAVMPASGTAAATSHSSTSRSRSDPTSRRHQHRAISPRPKTNSNVASSTSAQPLFPRADDRLRPVGHLKLAEDRRDVVGHGLRCQAEAFGDGLVAQPAGNEIQDLALPVGQLRERSGVTVGEMLQDPGCHTRPEDRLTSDHAAEGTLEVVLSGPLEQVAL